MKATWKAWESKDGRTKRVYVSKIAYIEEGASGTCLTWDEWMKREGLNEAGN